LKKNDELATINVETTTSNWTPPPPGQNSTTWVFTATTARPIEAEGEVITLSIKNLKTTSASGLGYLYIDYQNIGSYPDGRLVVPIEKTPLLYRGQQVGIGTNTPDAKLHIGKVTESQVGLKVEGPSAKTDTTTKEILRFVRPGVQNQASEDKVSFKLGKFEQKSDGKAQLDIALKDVTVMSLREDGKVGIGTTAPSAKLHVNDGDVHISGTGKLGIGTTAPSAKLHVNDNAIVSGKLAIRTTTPTNIDLAIGDPQTGLKQEGENKLAIYTNSLARVRIDEGGRVGIGTATASAKLDVNGSVKLGEYSSTWKRFIFGSVKLDGTSIGTGFTCRLEVSPIFVTYYIKVTQYIALYEKCVFLVIPYQNVLGITPIFEWGTPSNNNYDIQVQFLDKRANKYGRSRFDFILIEQS
jgi:hypothetical protein